MLLAYQAGPYNPATPGSADFVPAIFLNLQCFCEIKGIAENDSLGSRVNSQFFVTGYQTVYKPEFVAGIAADTVKQFRLFAAEIAEEDTGSISIG